jgi:Protease inhibitor Inh
VIGMQAMYLVRLAVVLAALPMLAGCSLERFGSGESEPPIAQTPGPMAGAPSAGAAPAPRPTPPPVNMDGRWRLAAPGGGTCNMNFGAAAGVGEGTIAPEGGCPGNFFTSRKWIFEQGGLTIQDHTGQPLAQLVLAGSTRFEGQASNGQAVTLAR